MLRLLLSATAFLLVSADCPGWCTADLAKWCVEAPGTCACPECDISPPPPAPPPLPQNCDASCAADMGTPWSTSCDPMQSTVECSGCFECTLPCLPSNLQKGLLPAPGRTGWRGSTLEDTALGGGVYGVDYNEKYDSKLQIFRTFKGAGWGSLSDDELKFVKEGGIMFFSVHDTAWADIAAGKMDWALKEYVEQFKAVYPAKMFFCMTYEPELEAEGNDAGREPAGSSADYRAQWIYTHNYFKANGVTNAVWAMDYSTESRTEAYWPLVASLWPGDEYVDWLFFNIFTYSSTRGWSFDDMLSAEYNAYESMSGVEQEWMGEKYTVDYTTKPWGIGAWGAGGVLVFRMIDEPDRINFIKGAEEALNSDKYPRLHLQVYFDSTDGNTGMTCEIGNATWGRMGKGSDTDFTVTSNEPMFDAYKHFISSDYFSANDMSCALPTSGVYPGVDGLLGTAAVEELHTETTAAVSTNKVARAAGVFGICAAAAVAIGALVAAKGRRAARVAEQDAGKDVEMY